MTPKSCWVVYDQGKIGTLNQCLGLAEALGIEPTVKAVSARFPWSFLPPSFWFFPLQGLSKKGDYLAPPPWPDLIIAGGRASVAPVVAIRKITKGTTKVIQILHPHFPLKCFDAIVAPIHDNIKGPNVFTTVGALHRVTRTHLTKDAKKFSSLVASLPRPLVTVLIGGTNSVYTINNEVIEKLANDLTNLYQQFGASFAITISRRTPQQYYQLLIEKLKDVPTIIWDNQGENPYFGFLGLADFIIVTADSISMISEACYTGKPVYIYELSGGSLKFKRFHQSLYDYKAAQPFNGQLNTWDIKILDERSELSEKLQFLIN